MTTYLTFFILFISTLAIAQEQQAKLINESISFTSESKKILLISNQHQAVTKGERYLLLLDDRLVAKIEISEVDQNDAGLKINQVISAPRLASLEKGMNISLLKEETAPKTETPASVSSVENQSVGMVKQIAMNPNRVIQENHSFGVKYGRSSEYSYDQRISTEQIGLNYQYQILDNTFVEAGVDHLEAKFEYPGTVDSYYSSSVGTPQSNTYTTMSAKIKYALEIPYVKIIFMPYLGFRKTSLSSGETYPEDSDEYKEMLSNIKKRMSGMTLGATFMKKVYNDWYLRADIGSDATGGAVGLNYMF